MNRYIHDFEAVIRRVLAERDGGPMAVAMLSSDVGKLYVALAQAIERLRANCQPFLPIAIVNRPCCTPPARERGMCRASPRRRCNWRRTTRTARTPERRSAG